jgi:exodeoxyribonuclease-5
LELTSGQIEALNAVKSLQSVCKDGGGIAVICGYAGTGKTTLLKTIAEDQEITVLTPTGKAAQRVREIVPDAVVSTVHRWLYDVKEDEQTGKLTWNIKDSLQLPANRTIFVDEASMISYKMFEDLYTKAKREGFNLVYIGDNFQLPPIENDERFKGFNVLSPGTPCNVRVQMDEVVRQALDNPIVRASMEIRDMRSMLPTLSSLPTVSSVDFIATAANTFNDGGIIICHRNATRHSLNADIRKQLGFTTDVIQRGEPLMCVQNNYDLNVYNGEIFVALSKPELVGDKEIVVRDRFANESGSFWFYSTEIETLEGRRKALFADREVFGQSKINSKFVRRAGQDLSRQLIIQGYRAEGITLNYTDLQEIHGTSLINANLGYVLTAHKAQGSEWPSSLILVEDSVRMHTLEGRRWLYTAATRAKNNLKLCWQ